MASIFENQTCSRCGGGGSYSYNLMHGSRCYGCGGCGTTLTKRGRAAQAKLAELQSKPVSTVKVGDNVWYDPYLGGAARWCFVADIREDTANPGSVWLDLKRKGKLVVHAGHRLDSIVRSVRDEAERAATVAAALAFQATLGATGKPSKNPPPVVTMATETAEAA